MRFPRPGRHGGEAWTSIGIGSSNELERLPAATFTGVLIVWAIAVLLAVLRSMWDQHKEKGLDDKTIKNIAHSVPLRGQIGEVRDQVGEVRGQIGQVRDQMDEVRDMVQALLLAQQKAQALGGAPLEPQTSGQVTSGDMTISEVRGIIEGFEGQMGEVRDQIGQVRDMVQALLVAQQKAQALASGGTGGSHQEAQARRRRRHPPSLLEQR